MFVTFRISQRPGRHCLTMENFLEIVAEPTGMRLAFSIYRREGLTWRQALTKRRKLLHSIERLYERSNAKNAGPKCILSRCSNPIYRAIAVANAGSMPRSGSCAIPSLTCAILPKVVPRTSLIGKLSSTSPRSPPLARARPFHLTFLSTDGVSLKQRTCSRVVMRDTVERAVSNPAHRRKNDSLPKPIL